MPKLEPIEKAEARRLRAEEGFSLQHIARLLGVSVSSVFAWTRDPGVRRVRPIRGGSTPRPAGSLPPGG